jgi:hypothetical protein
MTLVITNGDLKSEVLWAELDVANLAEARATLLEREWKNGDPDVVVGAWSRMQVASPFSESISRWAKIKGSPITQRRSTTLRRSE